MVNKVNCILNTFPGVGPFILTRLFQAYCLSLYSSNLLTLYSPALKSLEIDLNKILRCTYLVSSLLQSQCPVPNLVSLYNTVGRRSQSLVIAASNCPFELVWKFFVFSVSVCHSFCGYNTLCGSRHLAV